MSPPDGLAVRRDGPVAIVQLDRSQSRNAVNVAMACALAAELDRIERDPTIRAWVLAATPNPSDVFCAGADLKDLAAGRAHELMTSAGFAGLTHAARTKPVVAAVDGLATAGGCELVLACDLVVASTRSAFGLAEVRRNLLASGGGAYRLPRALGTRVGLEAMLTGLPVTADRAFQLGMVNRLCAPDEVLDEAIGLCQCIAENAPLATAAARRIALAAFDEDEEELQRRSRAESDALRGTNDTNEGLAAFLGKRLPQWTGT